jgi:hypothetical protein
MKVKTDKMSIVVSSDNAPKEKLSTLQLLFAEVCSNPVMQIELALRGYATQQYTLK